MKMAYLRRCDWLKGSEAAMVIHGVKQRPNAVTGSVECDIYERKRQREEFSLQNQSKKRTSELRFEKNVWNAKHCKI